MPKIPEPLLEKHNLDVYQQKPPIWRENQLKTHKSGRDVYMDVVKKSIGVPVDGTLQQIWLKSEGG